MDSFKECASCAAKPGSPPLCPSCLHNRQIIDELKDGLAIANKSPEEQSLDFLLDATKISAVRSFGYFIRRPNADNYRALIEAVESYMRTWERVEKLKE